MIVAQKTFRVKPLFFGGAKVRSLKGKNRLVSVAALSDTITKPLCGGYKFPNHLNSGISLPNNPAPCNPGTNFVPFVEYEFIGSI